MRNENTLPVTNLTGEASKNSLSCVRINVQLLCSRTEMINNLSQDLCLNDPLILHSCLIEQGVLYRNGFVGQFIRFNDSYCMFVRPDPLISLVEKRIP